MDAKKTVKGNKRKESCKENFQIEEIIEIFCRKIFLIKMDYKGL